MSEPVLMVDPTDLQLKPLTSPLRLLNGETVMGDLTQEQGVRAGRLIPQAICPLSDGFIRRWGAPPWQNMGDGTALPVFADISLADIAAAQAVVDATNAEAQADALAKQQAQYNAAVTTLTPLAQLYRATLTVLFGDGAETNTTISQLYIEGYFANLIAINDTLTTLQLTQLTVLREGFTALSQLTGDGTTWSFPWNLIPQQ